MGALLAAGAAMAWGITDYVGGHAARSHSALAVTTWKNAWQFGFLIPLAVWVGGNPSTVDLFLGVVSGLTGGFALTILYGSLARGNVSVVASVGGATLAVVPATWGMATGDDISVARLSGVAACVIAIALIAQEKQVNPALQSIREAVVAGVLFGIGAGSFFIIIGRAGEAAGLWPVLLSNVGAAFTLGAVGLARHTQMLSGAPRASLLPGGFDATGQTFFVFASHRADLSVVSVIASMAPAITALLGILLLRERPPPLRLAGFSFALAGVLLVGLT